MLGVPGNHDVPLYDVLRRFLSPLTRYKRYIDDELCPFHELPGATVLGINTARSLTFKDGRISHEQMQFIRDTFARTDPQAMRILVTHHPLFALPVGDGPELGKAIGRQELALDAIAEAGVDLLLAGHNHRASAHHASDLVTRAGSALVIQAGTATSTRLRDEEQSFNRIDIDGDERHADRPGAGPADEFASGDAQLFVREGDHWRIAGAEQEIEADRALSLSARAPLAYSAGQWTRSPASTSTISSRRVLAEDLGEGGDVTSTATIAAGRALHRASMNCREAIVVAGLDIAAAFFRALDREVRIEHAGRGRRPRRRRHGADAPRRQCPRDARRRALGAQHAAASVGHRDADPPLCRRDRRHRRDPARHAQDASRACARSTNMRRGWAARRTTGCGSTTAC